MDFEYTEIFICCYKTKDNYVSTPLAIFLNEEDAKEYVMDNNTSMEYVYFYYPEKAYNSYFWKKTI